MTDNEKDEIFRIIETFNRNVKRIERCLKAGFKEESIILIVSTFEAFLRDLFVIKKSRWFFHKLEGPIPYMMKPETRENIRKYLEKIKAYEEFLKIRYVYSEVSYDLDVTSLYEVLIKQRKINFQNLNDNDGVRAAYKAVFDIDLRKNMSTDSSTSKKLWDNLVKLFKERHTIIHKGKETTISEENIRAVLNSIKYLKHYLIESLGPYVLSDGRSIAFQKNDNPRKTKLI